MGRCPQCGADSPFYELLLLEPSDGPPGEHCCNRCGWVSEGVTEPLRSAISRDALKRSHIVRLYFEEPPTQAIH